MRLITLSSAVNLSLGMYHYRRTLVSDTIPFPTKNPLLIMKTIPQENGCLSSVYITPSILNTDNSFRQDQETTGSSQGFILTLLCLPNNSFSWFSENPSSRVFKLITTRPCLCLFHSTTCTQPSLVSLWAFWRSLLENLLSSTSRQPNNVTWSSSAKPTFTSRY